MSNQQKVIAGYIQQGGEIPIDFMYYHDCILKLAMWLQDQSLIKFREHGVEVIEITGMFKEDSEILKTKGYCMVSRDLEKRLGDYCYFAINSDTLEKEKSRDYIIPADQVIQRWIFSIKVRLEDQPFTVGDYKYIYNESELPENYGEAFWKSIENLQFI